MAYVLLALISVLVVGAFIAALMGCAGTRKPGDGTEPPVRPVARPRRRKNPLA